MSTAAVQSTPASQAAATRALAPTAQARAVQRAIAERIIPFPAGTDSRGRRQWAVKSYTVTEVGDAPASLICSCPASGYCKHIAVVAYCRESHIAPVRPSVVLCANCHDAQVSAAGDWCEGCRNLRDAAPTMLHAEGWLADEIAADRVHMLPRRLQVVR